MALTKAMMESIQKLKAGKKFQLNPQWVLNPEYAAALTEVVRAVAPPAPPEKPEQENERGKTVFCTNPNVGSLNALIHAINVKGEVDSISLNEAIKKLATGSDTSEIQTMLAAQAITLQAIFNFQMIHLKNCRNLEQTEAVMARGLKAQEQCRKTLQTLSEVKNPRRPSQFIKTYVNQQLNQLRLEQQNSENFQTNPSNELLKEASNEALDIGGAAKTAGTDPKLEAVGEINRPENL